MIRRLGGLLNFCLLLGSFGQVGAAGGLRAGVAKVDITERHQIRVNRPIFAKALVLQSEEAPVVLLALDVVALGGVWPIRNDFLPNLRARLEKECGIAPDRVFVNASHRHGIPAQSPPELAFEAVQTALKRASSSPDCDCVVDPAWRGIFESRALSLLKKIVRQRLCPREGVAEVFPGRPGERLFKAGKRGLR